MMDLTEAVLFRRVKVDYAPLYFSVACLALLGLVVFCLFCCSFCREVQQDFTEAAKELANVGIGPYPPIPMVDMTAVNDHR